MLNVWCCSNSLFVDRGRWVICRLLSLWLRLQPREGFNHSNCSHLQIVTQENIYGINKETRDGDENKYSLYSTVVKDVLREKTNNLNQASGSSVREEFIFPLCTCPRSVVSTRGALICRSAVGAAAFSAVKRDMADVQIETSFTCFWFCPLYMCNSSRGDLQSGWFDPGGWETGGKTSLESSALLRNPFEFTNRRGHGRLRGHSNRDSEATAQPKLDHKARVQHSPSCWELDKKIDTDLMAVK